MKTLQELKKLYADTLVKDVVPFWEAHCPDRKFGGYFNCLDRDGNPYDTEKHMWMQWRIVYMFSELATSEFGKGNSTWLKLAEMGFEFLTKHGKSEDGTYYFTINRDGTPSIAPYNIYSDCFAAMGSAALFKATGREDCRKEAISAMDSYIRRMDNPKGRWSKAMPGKRKRLSLGHYMILANLGSVMREKLGTDRFEADTMKAADMALGRFFNPSFGVLFENVDPDGSFDLESCEGRHLNPGHGLEALWFIMAYGSRTGRTDIIEKAASIIKSTMKFAWDPKHGGLLYFMDALDKPNPELQWDMKLWWVHCEAIVALLMAYRLTGDKEFHELFLKVHDWTWSRFPDPGHGEWFAYLNRAGEPTTMLKGGKWKCFFHLPRMLLTCNTLFNEIENQK